MAACRMTMSFAASSRAEAKSAPPPPRAAPLAAPGRRTLQICRAGDNVAKNLGDKGIQLEGFDDMHNPMAGADFMAKLEEKLSGTAPEEVGLLSSEGKKASDSLELEFDPESLLGTPTDGLIARRERQKDAEVEAKAEEEAKAAWDEERQKLLAMRAARVVPKGDPPALAQFFFETELNEMEYECTRCRPELTEEFFAYLLKSAEEAEGEEEKEKYLVLHKATNDFVQFLDANAKALAAPADRMKQILEAKDKKAMILDMVSRNEIDTPLIALFQTNVNLARSAGQEDAAMFMEKVAAACRKYSGI